jgi:hypothetical protein
VPRSKTIRAKKDPSWVEAVFGPEIQKKVRTNQPSKGGWLDALSKLPKSSKRPTKGGWLDKLKVVPKPKRPKKSSPPIQGTWSERAEKARDAYRKAIAAERKKRATLRRAEREEKRARQAVVDAEAEICLERDRIALEKESEGRGWEIKVTRERNRWMAIDEEYPGILQKGAELQQWLDSCFTGGYVAVNRDGTIDGRLDIPTTDQRQLVGILGERMADLPLLSWVRVGWRFEIDPARRDPEPPSKDSPGRRGYDSLAVADVMSGWIHEPRGIWALVAAAIPDLANNGTIFDNMLQDEFNHKVLSAVVEIYYNGYDNETKPDRR